MRGLQKLFCWLPYRLALFVGACLAALAFHVIRFRVREAQRRIRWVVGDRVSPRAVRRMAWISLRNLFFNGVEIMRFPKMDRQWVETHIDTQTVEKLLDHAATKRGAVLAVPHLGNWDLAGVGASLVGVPIFFMARRQKNPLTDALLNQMRGATGVETILTDSGGALRKVIRNLNDGKVFAMLPDVRARETGIQVPFLGGDAALATGMELFSRRADVPIFPAFAVREGWTRHRWQVLDPVYPNPELSREADQQRIMREVMALFDQVIREHPEQYFWYNKRWILDPLKSARPASAAGG